jgi:hypothetical protein
MYCTCSYDINVSTLPKDYFTITANYRLHVDAENSREEENDKILAEQN